MHPKICRGILRFLQALPLAKRHLYGADGSIYMHRWNVVGEFKLDAQGKDILGTRSVASRVLSAVTGGRYHAIRLHCIVNADRDRDLHNHPFDFDSLILAGWYFENVIDGFKINMEGYWNHGRAGTFHRIAVVPAGGVWTLFFMTKNSNDWGFLVDGEFVKSTTYLQQRS